MKLFEHPDFAQAVLATREYLEGQRIAINEQLIEKDYYVTEALRVLAEVAGDRIIFKGGTSLSKGWNLIQRFSEDVDIFVDPYAYEPPLAKRSLDRELISLRNSINSHPGLTYVPGAGRTIGGAGRSDYFDYTQVFSSIGSIAPRVLIEMGCASGREPVEVVSLHSYIGAFLHETGHTLGAEDESPFSMRLLHYRRTFVEKMFAIHSKVQLFKRDSRPIGAYARHYYDLYQLAQLPAVQEMLLTDEYEAIKTDYEIVSRASFAGGYFAPNGMRFSNSDALFPAGELRTVIASEYTKQCGQLCFGAFPEWDEVEACFANIRSWL